MLKFIKVFRSQFEVCLNIIAKNYYLDLKIKEGKTIMERCLYHYKVVGEDAQGSCEDAICFKSYFVSRNS